MLVPTTQICSVCRSPIMYDIDRTIYLWHTHNSDWIREILERGNII